MPFYTTVPKVQAAVPRAVNSSTAVTSAFIATTINEADAIINGKLSKLYAVPASNCPLLETIGLDLTVHRILRRQFTQERKNKSEWVEQWKDSMDMLNALAKGDMTLVDATGAVVAKKVNAVWSNTEDYQPTFQEDGFVSSEIDGDKLDDIRDNRDG